jgi:hypothetical protein
MRINQIDFRGMAIAFVQTDHPDDLSGKGPFVNPL